MISSAVKRAFKMSGLNPSREDDCHELLGYLAALIYAGAGRGHPIEWTPSKLRRIAREVAAMQGNSTSGRLSERACCEQLIKIPRYKKYTARTLLRVLQRAKAIDSKRKQVEA
ncbi:hypothetical protein [Rhodoplanes sp. Z2-YC6860]|uniref:hypothetical protein n=1 Tax=Rhodoplanes sp. Z2-YC6860 TaxID=674703 RepID=UPI0012EEBAE9|nr:hypothetical protein [Rhodoplanes sp. Z2-YC6860]